MTRTWQESVFWAAAEWHVLMSKGIGRNEYDIISSHSTEMAAAAHASELQSRTDRKVIIVRGEDLPIDCGHCANFRVSGISRVRDGNVRGRCARSGRRQWSSNNCLGWCPR